MGVRPCAPCRMFLPCTSSRSRAGVVSSKIERLPTAGRFVLRTSIPDTCIIRKLNPDTYYIYSRSRAIPDKQARFVLCTFMSNRASSALFVKRKHPTLHIGQNSSVLPYSIVVIFPLPKRRLRLMRSGHSWVEHWKKNNYCSLCDGPAASAYKQTLAA